MEKQNIVVQFLYHQKNDEVFAFFPNEWESPVLRMSYSHIGQHSQCHLAYAKESILATENQYADLKKELEELVGYNLLFIQESKRVYQLLEVAFLLFNGYNGNEGTLDYSDKEYGYLSDEIEDVEVGFFRRAVDSDYAGRLYDEGYTITEQEAVNTLIHRIDSIIDEIKDGQV